MFGFLKGLFGSANDSDSSKPDNVRGVRVKNQPDHPLNGARIVVYKEKPLGEFENDEAAIKALADSVMEGIREKNDALEHASPEPTVHPDASLTDFEITSVEQALDSQEFASLQMNAVKEFAEAAVGVFQHRHPEMSGDEARSRVEHALVVKCPNCGEYDDSARDLVLLAGKGGALSTAKGAFFGGPNSASLASGKCPGCGGQSVLATFYGPRLRGAH